MQPQVASFEIEDLTPGQIKIFDRIKEKMIPYTKVITKKVELSSKFYTDLDMDYADLLEFVELEIENEFRMIPDPQKVREIQRVQDLVFLVDSLSKE